MLASPRSRGGAPCPKSEDRCNSGRRRCRLQPACRARTRRDASPAQGDAQRSDRSRRRCASWARRQAHRRRAHCRIPQRGRRRALRDRGAERHGRPQRRHGRGSRGSNSASASIWATSSRRPTATSWATASISPRGLESIAKPGAICLSEHAYWQVKGRLDLAVTDLGPTQLKNIAEPIRVYSLEVGEPAQPKPAPAPSPKNPPRRASRLSFCRSPISAATRSQEHFVDGVTESLTTDLSRIRGAFVIGRNTAFTLQGQSRRPEDRSAAS